MRADILRLGLVIGALALWGCGGEAPAASGESAEDVESSVDERRAGLVTRASQRVRVADASSGSLGQSGSVAGITSAFRKATVAAEVSARVVERHAEPGQSVAAGDPLVSLDATFLAIAVDEARATLRAREVDLAQARRELERGDDLARKDAISDGQHDGLRFARERAESARDLADAALRRTERTRADAVVRAPFAASVERIDVQVGDYLSAGAAVAVVADFHRVRLRAGVTANEAADLQPGSLSTVSIPALGGFETTAAIHSIGQMADATTGTYPVELWLDNPNLQIRGGMVARLALPAPEDVDGAIVPRAAILRREGGLAVYVVQQQGGQLRARVRPVRVGRHQGQLVELISGVEVGERVVIEGLFALTDGASVFIDESPEFGSQADAQSGLESDPADPESKSGPKSKTESDETAWND